MTENDRNSKESLDARVSAILHEQQIMAVEQAEKETEEQKKQQIAERRDRRAVLLNAVRVEAPELTTPLFEKMSALASENHEFASKEMVELFKGEQAKFKDEPDFFDLGVAQREDLLDRIGYYRGVVIDHNLSNPVEPGFRDILMRPDLGPREFDGLTINPPTLLYRKPNFSGYFENYFTTSSSVHQTQKNGVTNLQFSLAASGGKLAEFAASVGLASYDREETTSGYVGKTVYTTANFFLPKVELSFEHRVPCASEDFYNRCLAAMQFEAPAQKFHALKQVLDDFGHFIPTETLVGGRLFATERKLYDGKESSSSLTDRFAAKVKGSLSSALVDAEIGASYESSKQKAELNKEAAESQSMTFQAVGGEGTVVRDAGKWAESLYDYRRWAAVQRENMIASINVLPHELREQCWTTLVQYAGRRSKRELIFQDNAHFLFYGEYASRAGSRATEVFFSIGNLAYELAVAVTSVPPVHGLDGLLVKPEAILAQLWQMTEHGQLVSGVTRAASANGAERPIQFALAVDVPAGGANEKPAQEYPVKIQQARNVPSQSWEYPGSGELVNRALGQDFVLDAHPDGRLLMRKRSEAGVQSRLWILDEVRGGLPQQAKPNAEQEYIIVATDDGAALSIAEAEDAAYLLEKKWHSITARPDIGGKHQRWHLKDTGEVVAVLKSGEYRDRDVLLSVAASGELLAGPLDDAYAQRWIYQTDGRITPVSGPHVGKFVAKVETTKRSSGSELVLTQRVLSGQRWSKRGVDNQLPRSFLVQAGPIPDQEKNAARYVDNSALEINGYLRHITIARVTNRDRDDLTCIIAAVSDQRDGENIRGRNGPIASAENCLDLRSANSGNVFVDTQWLYLPDTPIHSLKLDFRSVTDDKNSKILGFMYREYVDGPWIGFNAKRVDKTAPIKKRELIAYQSPSPIGKRPVRAIGLIFNPETGEIWTRLLLDR